MMQTQKICTHTETHKQTNKQTNKQLEDREEQLAEFDKKCTGLESRTAPQHKCIHL